MCFGFANIGLMLYPITAGAPIDRRDFALDFFCAGVIGFSLRFLQCLVRLVSMLLIFAALVLIDALLSTSRVLVDASKSIANSTHVTSPVFCCHLSSLSQSSIFLIGVGLKL